VAEDLTLTTYYPSPRGVYQELRTRGPVAIGTTAPPADAAWLHVIRDHVTAGLNPTVRVDDMLLAGGDPTPFLINSDGSVGIGTTAINEKLEVNGSIRLSGSTAQFNIKNVAQPVNDSDVATRGWVLANSGGGVCYTNYGSSACATAAGFVPVLTGYTTAYWGYYSGTGPGTGGGLTCSSVRHDTYDSTNFYATSHNGSHNPVNTEPCVICCK
ncbi:MAG: hypothetical protein HYY15_04285, partial [Candidatus Omnitrophica bacterium]|nr:hypothetical protein [Candidatus Omnitrophota bacterium]